jgi:hypothetical protein
VDARPVPLFGAVDVAVVDAAAANADGGLTTTNQMRKMP